MTKRDRITIYCFLAFSIIVCEESWRLGLGDFNQPGPGFVPFGSAAIIIAMALIQLVVARGKRVTDSQPFFKKERLSPFLAVLAVCFGYGLLLEYLGFVLCTGLFVLVSLKSIEPKPWVKALMISVVTTFSTWLLFDYLLQMQAPKGRWVYPIYDIIRGGLWKY